MYSSKHNRTSKLGFTSTIVISKLNTPNQKKPVIGLKRPLKDLNRLTRCIHHSMHNIKSILDITSTIVIRKLNTPNQKKPVIGLKRPLKDLNRLTR